MFALWAHCEESGGFVGQGAGRHGNPAPTGAVHWVSFSMVLLLAMVANAVSMPSGVASK